MRPCHRPPTRPTLFLKFVDNMFDVFDDVFDRFELVFDLFVGFLGYYLFPL